MPKTKFQNVIFTIIMACIMVYGMIVYNVALNTGDLTGRTFLMALHEMPIMVPIAFLLEFFVVEKLATRLAFSFMQPTDRPQFITYAISLMIVCIMCPVMSLIATLLFKEPSFGTWINGTDLAAALLRPSIPSDFPDAFSHSLTGPVIYAALGLWAFSITMQPPLHHLNSSNKLHPTL